MTVSVVARRFVNTPSVLELYKEEHPGEDLGVDQDQVDALSNEYDKVTGNESYSLYRTLFERLPRPHASREGTEGFLEWIKDTVVKLIEMVKSFFKWLWGLVSSKQKALELKVGDLKDKIKKYGVKTFPTQYPKTIVDLWGSEKKPDPSLHWMVSKLNDAKSKIGSCVEYIKAMEKFLDEVKGHFRPGYIYEAEKAVNDALAEFVKAVAKAFTNGELGKDHHFLGAAGIIVGDKGVPVIQIDTKLAALGNKFKAEFTSNMSEVTSAVDALNGALSEMEDLNKRLARLENEIIKDLTLLMKNASEGDHGKHKEVVNGIVTTMRSVIGSFMGNVKNLEQACFKPLTTAAIIIKSSLAK